MRTEVRGWSRCYDGKSLRAAAAIAMLVLVLVLNFGGAAVQEAWAVTATGGAKVHKLEPFTTYTKYDITGDGVPDEIEIVPSFFSSNDGLFSDGVGCYGYAYRDDPSDMRGVGPEGCIDGCYENLFIYVNGKLAYKKLGISDWPYYDSLEAYHITLKNGFPHLFLATRGNSDNAKVCGVFSYQRGKLRQTLNDKNFIPKKYTCAGRAFFLSKVSGDKIILKHQMNLRTVGAMLCEAPYAYKSGKFVRQGTTFKPKVGMPLRYGKSYKALKSLTVYKNASCKSKKFIIKKGQKVKFAKLYVRGSRVALQVKLGKKTGWIKCASSAKSALLVESGDPWVGRVPPFKGLDYVA